MAGNGRHWQQEFSQGSSGNDGMVAPGYGSMNSTANANGGTPPHRPARSVRRPTRAGVAPSAAAAQGVQAGSSSSAAGSSSNKASKLAQAIQREERQRDKDRGGSNLRPGSSMSFRSSSPTGSIGDDIMEGTEYYASSTANANNAQNNTSPVLDKAIAAFANAGRSQGRSNAGKGKGPSSASRDPESSRGRSTTGSGAATPKAGGGGEEPAGNSRTRRGAVGVQGESSRIRGNAAQEALPSTPAFREMERVLAQVANEWPELLPPGTGEGLATQEGEEEDVQESNAFDPVTLALSLVDPEATQDRFRSFLATKEALARSLKSSIQTHYRSFDASVSSYNGLQTNLSFAQKNASSLRSTLEEVRETLGKGRAELGVLESRRTELNEMDRILVGIETLKNVPDRLETLLSEKRFFPASVLLMRSLKMINKQDMLEVQATADLRAYFVSQETLMLEFLTEELHNHLYLKSFYTDSRWKSHKQGQTDLPAFVVETAAPSIFDYATDPPPEDDDPTSPTTTSNSKKKQQTKLSQYLIRLSQRPSHIPSIDEAVDEGVPLEALLGPSAGNGEDAHLSAIGMTKSGSTTSMNGMTPSQSVTSGLGIASSSSQPNGLNNHAGLNGLDSATSSSKLNPEQDSFAYIETILESLAYLGKLGHGMDSVLQRAPIEIYNLVEGTVVDVDERNDPIRRNSMRIARFGNSPKMLFSGTFGAQNSAAAYSLLIRSSLSSANLSSSDDASSLVQLNTEILMDFFWTLFSKLDAVLQGFRVVHEVLQRIVGRQGFKDGGLMNKSGGGAFFSLQDVWRPVQIEIQALLHDYLIDEANGTISSRSPIASINETLRLGRPIRDPSKSLFKFSDTDAKNSSRRIKPFEDSLNKSLKVSVPGLVSSLAEGSSAGLSNASNAISLNSTAPSSGSAGNSVNASANAGATERRNTVVGRTHRMLVPPNAFQLDSLVLPTMRFLERAKGTLPDGMVSLDQETVATNGIKRYSGLMDDDTIEKLGPALEAWRNKNVKPGAPPPMPPRQSVTSSAPRNSTD